MCPFDVPYADPTLNVLFIGSFLVYLGRLDLIVFKYLLLIMDETLKKYCHHRYLHADCTTDVSVNVIE